MARKPSHLTKEKVKENQKKATLKKAILKGAILTGAILTGAILTGAILPKRDSLPKVNRPPKTDLRASRLPEIRMPANRVIRSSLTTPTRFESKSTLLRNA